MSQNKRLKIAIVHDWLIVYGGAERVLESILNLYPSADIFTLYDFMPEGDRKFLEGKNITTSFLQKMPFAKKRYRDYLPLMPFAVEQFDLSKYDLIISSNHAVVHGALTNSEQLHISYFNNTMVYAWDLYHYYLSNAGLNKGLKGFISKSIMHYIRNWDSKTGNRVDNYIANSQYMSRRINKLYNKNSTVIYPPVDIDKFELEKIKDDYYIIVTRLVPFKRIDIVVEAFSKLNGKKLIIIGDGPEMSKLKKLSGSNIEFLGFQNRDVVNKYLKKAKAFIFTSAEPFGIAVVEALACGTPVIGFAGGATLEIVTDNVNGRLYKEQNAECLAETIKNFETEGDVFNPETIKHSSLKFSHHQFNEKFHAFVEKCIDERFK